MPQPLPTKLLFFLLTILLPIFTAIGADRSTLFNTDWKFIHADPKGAESPTFNDTTWRTLNLPHDWSIEGPFDEKWASCTAYLPGGIGWYRKTFTLPADQKYNRISIYFEGVYEHSQVWLNGHLLGSRPSGFVSFAYDLTPYLNFSGAPNVIAVRVDRSSIADCRWYPGAGIYRNVFLITTDYIHIPIDGTFVTTHGSDIQIQTTVQGAQGGIAGTFPPPDYLITILRDATGKELQRTQRAQLRLNGEETITQNLTANNPHLWSLSDPYLYDIESDIELNGKIVDVTHTSFGIRSIRFDADHGFFLNDQPTKLKGVCLHQDLGALGVAVPAKIWEHRLQLLKEAGCNAIRTSHNPPSPEFLDLCDRMGFLVMDEAFDEWTRGKKKWTNGHNQGEFSTDGYWQVFSQWSDSDLSDMIRRDRNHPSIVLWSIGNEIDYPNDAYPPNSPELPPIAEHLVKVVKSLDTSRPVTAACAAPATNLFLNDLDIDGYNYMEHLYAGDHTANPKRVIFGSENAHTLNAWLAVKDNDFISGQFLWTGADYLGEAAPWPAHASRSGLIDMAGFPKPQYFLRQTLWAESPMVHLIANRFGLVCYTNCDSVELFQNNISLGEKLNAPNNNIVVWPLPKDHSPIKAVAKSKQNNQTVTDEVQIPGAPIGLKLLPGSTHLTADGQDITPIELNIVDAAAVRVPASTDAVTCAIIGPAKILAIENADITNHEERGVPTHHAYNGRMLIYLQSEKHPGEITLTVTAPNLKSDTIKLTAD
jgi:beta-galactosidase